VPARRLRAQIKTSLAPGAGGCSRQDNL
jgi:hypothetical protein